MSHRDKPGIKLRKVPFRSITQGKGLQPALQDSSSGQLMLPGLIIGAWVSVVFSIR